MRVKPCKYQKCILLNLNKISSGSLLHKNTEISLRLHYWGFSRSQEDDCANIYNLIMQSQSDITDDIIIPFLCACKCVYGGCSACPSPCPVGGGPSEQGSKVHLHISMQRHFRARHALQNHLLSVQRRQRRLTSCSAVYLCHITIIKPFLTQYVRTG